MRIDRGSIMVEWIFRVDNPPDSLVEVEGHVARAMTGIIIVAVTVFVILQVISDAANQYVIVGANWAASADTFSAGAAGAASASAVVVLVGVNAASACTDAGAATTIAVGAALAAT
jgi:hypothetical protein